MKHRVWLVLCLLMAAMAVRSAMAAERFPPPDFTDHQLPQTTTPPASPLADEYINVAALGLGLALASYLALVRRSRKGLFALTIVALAWFGFWRQGCICPVGSIQNVALAAADPAYTIPFSVVALFALPILFALFFGRTFCAAICPLGAIQELVAIRPVRVPRWLDHGLGLLPYVYLGAAVLFAATGSAFIICEYDPFVSFFRLRESASQVTASMLVLGGCFLVVGLFVGRPYCRYVCPYGAILGLCSKVSKRHVRIPPEECIQCRLCEDACPYGAILEPTVEQSPKERARSRRRLATAATVLPVIVALGAVLGYGLGTPLSRLHPTVRLAEYVRMTELNPAEESLSEQEVAQQKEQSPQWKRRVDAVEAFRNTGRPVQELFDEALALRGRFAWLGGLFGAWVGLVIGGKLVHLSLRRRRVDYEPDKANCVSCGRCFWYCPHEQVRLGLIETIPAMPVRPAPVPGNGEDKTAKPRETRAP